MAGVGLGLRAHGMPAQMAAATEGCCFSEGQWAAAASALISGQAAFLTQPVFVRAGV